MQRMMRVFGTKSRKDNLVNISTVIPIDILEKCQVRLFRDIHSTIPKFKRQGNMKIISENF